MTSSPPLTSIPLPRAIFRLAWPAMTSMMLVNIFNLVDAFWVGRLGTSALGGMTASAFLVWCLHAAGQLVNTGVNAVVARRVGEGAPREAGVAAGQGLLLALGLAFFVMALGLPLQVPVFRALGLTAEVQAAAVAYLTPVLWGFPTVTLWYAVEATFRGSGDTRTPMLVLAVTLALNAALDPLLIFGPGPFPALGIAGAAWATVLAHLLGVVTGLALLRARAVRPRLAGGPRPELLWVLLRVGAPIAITSLLFSVIYLLLTPIIAHHGSPAVAAIGIGHRVEGLCYFTCMGFAAAAATLVGQNLGAGEPGRAERAAWLTTGVSAALLAVLSVTFYLTAPQIFAIFSADPEVISQGTRYLRIVALFETAMALELVLEGAFSGAGDTLPPMLVGVPLTAARIPAAFLLSRHPGLGVSGIWWAISVSTLLKGLLTGAWFRLGRWKRARV